MEPPLSLPLLTVMSRVVTDCSKHMKVEERRGSRTDPGHLGLSPHSFHYKRDEEVKVEQRRGYLDNI